jgi:O-antigen/teichoic acid export membrane protein
VKRFFKNLYLSPQDIFHTNYLTDDLARRSIRGGAVTIASRGGMVFLNLLRTILLARLLTPQDFGIIAMVSVFIGLANLFKDAGLSMATIQKDVITAGQISTLFWANIVISFFLGGIIVAIAPLISIFYDRPELTAVTIALALSFVIQGVSLQHSALLRRHMRFIALGTIEILGAIVGLIVAVFLALQGWSYWALVYSNIFTSLSIVIFTIFFCPWIPGGIKGGTGVRQMLSFGINITGYNFVNYFSQHADKILIGKFIGADALGLYNKSYQVISMPMAAIRRPIANVAMPAFSRIQNNPQTIRNYTQYYIFLLSFFTMPLMIIGALFPEEIILLVFGEQWVEAAQVFQILSVIGFIQPASSVTGLLLVSCGKAKQNLRKGLFVSIITVSSFLVGLNWGVYGVAVCYAIATYSLLIPTLWYTSIHTSLHMSVFFLSIWRPCFASILSVFIFYYLINPFLKQNNNIFVLVEILLFLLLYLFVFSVTPNGIYVLKKYVFKVFKSAF